MISRRTFIALPLARLLPGLLTSAQAAEESAPRRFMLEDVNGVVVTDEDLQGRLVLLFFGYTNCPDVCPTTLMSMSNVLHALGPQGDKVLPLFISLDPDRDTRKLLASYMQSFDPRIVALRGPKPYVDAAADAYGVTYHIVTTDPSRPDDYQVDHSAWITLQDPAGQIITRLTPGMTVEDMAARIRDALAASPQ